MLERFRTVTKKDGTEKTYDLTKLEDVIEMENELSQPLDREKIIEGLKALDHSMSEHQCYACGHDFIETVQQFGTNIIGEAIAYLEDQGPAEIIRKEETRMEEFRSTLYKVFVYHCGNCNAKILTGDKYCHECGQKLKWE